MNELEEQWENPFYSSFAKTLSFTAINNLKGLHNDKEREFAMIYVRDWINKRININRKEVKIPSKELKQYIKEDLKKGLDTQDIAYKYNKSLRRIQQLIMESKKDKNNDKR